MSEVDEVQYVEHTESAPLMFDELRKIGAQPKTILAVVGSGWPAEFKEEYPEAEVYSFDKDQSQLDTYGPSTIEITGHKPVRATVPMDSFARLLERVNPDTLFLSNILDYVDRMKLSHLAALIDDNEVKNVIFSGLGWNLARQDKFGNTEFLADELAELGYDVRKSKSDAEVGDLYIATIT